MSTDAGERTEDATPKRMKEVREKGELSKSEDLAAWIGVGAAVAMLPLTIARASESGTDQVFSFRALIADPEPELAQQMLDAALGSLAYILGPFFIVVLLVVIGTALIQGGIHFKKFKGKFEQFNLVTGVKRVFGTQALWQGVKALLKTAVVGFVLVVVVQALTPVLMSAGGLSVASLLAAAKDGAGSLLQSAVLAGLVLAAADILVVMRRNRKRTKMTLKEVKDENKNSEGDPLIKGQRRSRQLAMSRNRMIAAVGDADVVMINPTHVAVALKYEPGRAAPKVVAKGADLIATRIRQEAEDKGVPMVTDIPLARALHAACDIGQEIPMELYNAVARVLAFVMALKSRGAARGHLTMPEPAMNAGDN